MGRCGSLQRQAETKLNLAGIILAEYYFNF